MAGRRGLWAVLLGVLLGWPVLMLMLTPAAADIAPGNRELQVKAAYLYKFAEFVEWPASALPQATAPIVIGVVGADELVGELKDQVAGRTVNEHPILVKPLKPDQGLNGVQVLFIGRQEEARLKRLLEDVRAKPVLTVTEASGALNQGSIINFVLLDNRLRFEISLGVAERSGLKLSSRLLAVALQVTRETP